MNQNLNFSVHPIHLFFLAWSVLTAAVVGPSIAHSQPVTCSQSSPCSHSVAGSQSITVVKNCLGCEETIHIRPQDELWVVSARECTAHPDDISLLQIKRYVHNQWVDATLDELAVNHQTDPSHTTTFYVHGNSTNYEYGIARGFQFYNNMTSDGQTMKPLRYVLWLWQSEKELNRLYPDFRAKSERAICLGQTLGKTLVRLGDQRAVLAGFSLGSQVIISALDMIETGQINTNCSCAGDFGNNISMQGGYRVALIAAATDPEFACQAASRTVNSTLTYRSCIFFNRADRAVKAFRIALRRSCPDKRVSISNLVQDGRLHLGDTSIVDISREIGHRHDVVLYSKSPTLKCELAAMVQEVAGEQQYAPTMSMTETILIE